jgi:hypothetical protein
MKPRKREPSNRTTGTIRTPTYDLILDTELNIDFWFAFLSSSHSGTVCLATGTFLVGTVMAMASYTFFLGVSSSALAKMRGGADTIKKVSSAAALIALGVGLSLIINAALGR